jgi:hypothetical protein
MNSRAAVDFIESFYEDVIAAMADADSTPVSPQYRLGIRRLASAFFHKFELFEMGEIIPNVTPPDVDTWFSGRE